MVNTQHTEAKSKIVDKTTVHTERTQTASVQPISVAGHISESTRKLRTIDVEEDKDKFNKSIWKATHNLDEVLAKRQEEARLTATELHEKQVMKSVTEVEKDTHKAVEELDKKAKEHEHKVLEKMDEIKSCAKDMMKDAKHQMEEYEHQAEKEKTGFFTKIKETFSSKNETKAHPKHSGSELHLVH